MFSVFLFKDKTNQGHVNYNLAYGKPVRSAGGLKVFHIMFKQHNPDKTLAGIYITNEYKILQIYYRSIKFPGFINKKGLLSFKSLKQRCALRDKLKNRNKYLISISCP